MRLLLVLVLIATTGCYSRTIVTTRSSIQITSELDVIASFIKLQHSHSISNHLPIVIKDTLSVSMLRLGESYDDFERSLLSEAKGSVTADMIKDFCEKNRNECKTWVELPSILPVILISDKELDVIFPDDPELGYDGWQVFHSKYSNTGITVLSRVGFNRRGDMAMLYVEYGVSWTA